MTGGWSVQSQPDACPRLPIRPQAYKKADFVLGAGKAAREDGDGASGSIIIVFVQITWRHFKMQLFDNKYSTFLGVAWCHQIEATARANVPQRCLEQRFACAVICREPVKPMFGTRPTKPIKYIATRNSLGNCCIPYQQLIQGTWHIQCFLDPQLVQIIQWLVDKRGAVDGEEFFNSFAGINIYP